MKAGELEVIGMSCRIGPYFLSGKWGL